MRSSKKMRTHLAKVFARKRKAEAEEDRKAKATAVKKLIDGLKRYGVGWGPRKRQGLYFGLNPWAKRVGNPCLSDLCKSGPNERDSAVL